MFSDVVASSVVRILPVAGKDLAKDWVQGLLYPPKCFISRGSRRCDITSSRRFDVPTAQVEFNYRHKTLDGIVDLRHRKQCLRMGHETVVKGQSLMIKRKSPCALGNSLQHRPWL